MIRAGFNDQTTKIGKDNLKACFNELKTASSSSAVDAAFAWAGFNTSGYKISKAGVQRVLNGLKTGYTSTTAVDNAMSAAGFNNTTKISKAGLKNVLNVFRDMVFADISVIVVGASGTIVKTTIQRE